MWHPQARNLSSIIISVHPSFIMLGLAKASSFDFAEMADEKYGTLPPYYEKLFTPEPFNEHRLFMRRFYYWGVPALIGVMSACVTNYFLKKPAFSGIQKHIVSAAVCVGLGEATMRYADHRSQERDAVLRRYILLHPEDFPEPERKKYRDVLEPWIPVR